MLKVFHVFLLSLATEGHTNHIFYCSSPKDEDVYFYEHRTGRNTLAVYVQPSTVTDLVSYDLFHICL